MQVRRRPQTPVTGGGHSSASVGCNCHGAAHFYANPDAHAGADRDPQTNRDADAAAHADLAPNGGGAGAQHRNSRRRPVGRGWHGGRRAL